MKFEPFMYLSLPVSVPPNVQIKSLDQALKGQPLFLSFSVDAVLYSVLFAISVFSTAEDLEEPCWNCPRCRMKVSVKKFLKLVNLPPVLIIHLKRFEFTYRSFRKIEGRVFAPIVGLNMTDLVEQKQHPVYDLYAVIDHSGTFYFLNQSQLIEIGSLLI